MKKIIILGLVIISPLYQEGFASNCSPSFLTDSLDRPTANAFHYPVTSQSLSILNRDLFTAANRLSERFAQNPWIQVFNKRDYDLADINQFKALEDYKLFQASFSKDIAELRGLFYHSTSNREAQHSFLNYFSNIKKFALTQRKELDLLEKKSGSWKKVIESVAKHYQLQRGIVSELEMAVSVNELGRLKISVANFLEEQTPALRKNLDLSQIRESDSIDLVFRYHQRLAIGEVRSSFPKARNSKSCPEAVYKKVRNLKKIAKLFSRRPAIFLFFRTPVSDSCLKRLQRLKVEVYYPTK